MQGGTAGSGGGGGPPQARLPLSFQISGRMRCGAETGDGLGWREPGGCPVCPLLHLGGHWHCGRRDADGRREPRHCLLRPGGPAAYGFCGYPRAFAGGGAGGKSHYLNPNRICPLSPNQCRRPYGGGGPGGGPAGDGGPCPCRRAGPGTVRTEPGTPGCGAGDLCRCH